MMPYCVPDLHVVELVIVIDNFRVKLDSYGHRIKFAKHTFDVSNSKGGLPYSSFSHDDYFEGASAVGSISVSRHSY